MSEFNIHAGMSIADHELFYKEGHEYTALESHVIKAAAFVDLHDTLITYNPYEWAKRGSSFERYVELDNYNKFEFNDMVPAFIIDVSKFRTAKPDLYAGLSRLHIRARAAACAAVASLWIEKAPLQYLDFSRSNLSLKDFMLKQQEAGKIR